MSNIIRAAQSRAIEYLTLASALTLGTAYLTQYGPEYGIDQLFGIQLGLDPCALCYYQRYHYMVVILIGLLATIALRGVGKRTRACRSHRGLR